MKVTIIINGKRSLKRDAKLVIEQLQSLADLKVIIQKTQGPKEAIELARKAANTSNIIISVGGDGTNNEVLNGIMLSENPHIPLALLPNGTGNDFMKMLPDFRIDDFIEAVKQCRINSVDCGVLLSEDKKIYFLNIADVGFGAEVVRIMDDQRKKNMGGKFSYSVAIVRAFFNFRKPKIRLSFNGKMIESKLLMTVFANGSNFGHGIGIYPDASLSSGKLGLTIIGNINLMTYVKYLKKLKRGVKIEHPEVQYSSFENLSIELIEGKMNTEADGEFIQDKIVEVRVLPKAVNLIF